MASRSATPASDAFRKKLTILLRRLRTDVIDLYQVHWPDPNVPIEETARAMAELQRAGRIRFVGVSNFSPAQIETFRKAAPVQTVQSPYNLFERAIEEDVLPYCCDKSIATLAYGSLCRGLLSGRMTAQTKFEGDDLRKVDPKFRAPRFEQYLRAVERLDRFAQANYGRRVLPSETALGPRPAGTRRSRSGARAGLTNSPRSPASRAGILTRPPWPRSIGSFQKRS